jgi:putative oxidoreductase
MTTMFAPAQPTQRSDSAAIGLAVLRVLLGVVFIVHGAQKLFVFGLPGVTAGFGQMGVPMPAITAPLVAILEFAGGLALVAGLFTRIVSFALAIDMLGAIAFVHLKNGFFMPQGYEFALTLFVALVALVLSGPGAFSLDGARAARRGSR